MNPQQQFRLMQRNENRAAKLKKIEEILHSDMDFEDKMAEIKKIAETVKDDRFIEELGIIRYPEG